MVISRQAQPADRVAVRVGRMAIGFGRFAADVLAAAAFSLPRASPKTPSGVRIGPVANGHSYASWVTHLALLHLGAVTSRWPNGVAGASVPRRG